MRRWLVAILLLAALVGGLAWWGLGDGERPIRQEVVTEPEAPDPPPESLAEVSEPAEELEPEESRAPATSPEAPASPEAQAVPAFTFVGILVRPDREPVRAERISATLRGNGLERHVEQADVAELTIEGIDRGHYVLEISGPGFRDATQELDLTRSQIDGLGEHVLAERVYLWPEIWIPVVIETRDGRPFRALAEDLGLEPKRLFVDAFRVGVGQLPFAPVDPPPSMSSELAVFHPPPGYQNVELPGGVAGSLELLVEPPLWAGLWVHGVHLDDRLLQPGDTEVRFQVELEDLDRRLAALTLRLVDRDTGDPVTDAHATLKADTSAHRRHDLQDVTPKEGGHLHFRRVIPGQHELTILREGHIVQRRFELGPSERRDLGDVPIGSGPGLRIVVVDENGEPVPSWIEIAPHEPGRHVESVYPPNLHRQTDGRGVSILPIPDQPSIVRARPFLIHGRFRQYAEVGTRNVLVDPGDLPEELRLVAGDPVDLEVVPVTPWVEGHRITFEDELGMIVSGSGGERDGKLSADLAPGPYLARRWDGDREVGRLDVVVERETPTISAP